MYNTLFFLLDILRIIKLIVRLKTNNIKPEIIKSERVQSISSVKFIPINGIINNKRGLKTFLDILKIKNDYTISVTVLSLKVIYKMFYYLYFLLLRRVTIIIRSICPFDYMEV